MSNYEIALLVQRAWREWYENNIDEIPHDDAEDVEQFIYGLIGEHS